MKGRRAKLRDLGAKGVGCSLGLQPPEDMVGALGVIDPKNHWSRLDSTLQVPQGAFGPEPNLQRTGRVLDS